MKLSWLVVVAAVGCGYPNSRYDLHVRDEIPAGGDGFSLALYQSVKVEMKPGHQISLVNNGAVFDTLVEEISKAKSSIHIVAFIWRAGQPSDRLIEAISERARAGVSCRVIVDPLGSTGFDEEVKPRLAAAGCDTRAFRPLDRGFFKHAKNRNHRKIAIIDGKVGVTGGYCIYKSWLGEGLKEDQWRDTNVRVTGPAVREMQQAFAANWQEAGGALLRQEAFPELPDAPAGVRAGFVASSETAGISAAQRMIQVVLATAKKRIWISNAYFIPSTAIGDVLVDKAKRGVDVRVVAAGRVHDWKTVRAAQRSTYDRLLEAGIRIWEYQPSMLHSKTIVVDDGLAVVGSTNFDTLSLNELEEGALVAEDPALVSQMSEAFEVDVSHSVEIRKDAWARRGLLDRLFPKMTPLVGGLL